METTTTTIRNVALIGDSGTGKTMLCDALLASAGAIKQRGSIDRGTTVTDFDPLEKKLGHSLDVAFCHCEAQGMTINVADTPGYADFLGRTYAALEAVETAVVVVSASTGVGPMARRLMEFAKERGLCRAIVVNGIDRPDARPAQVLAEIRETFGKQCLALDLPAKDGRRVIDCFFQPAGEETAFSSVAAAHKEIVEQVVEVDEALMAKYLEQGQELTLEQLHDPFEKAMREGHLVPVCFTSAETGAGVAEALNAFAKLMPNPSEGNPPPFLKGEGGAATRVAVSADPKKHVLAHVFKVVSDPFVGKLSYVRVHQGTMRTGAPAFVGDAKKAIKIGRLYRVQGKDRTEIDTAVPGDIVALAKIEELFFDAVVHDSHDEDHHHLQSVSLPPAMAGLVIEAEKATDEQKLSDALHRIVWEDPSVRIEHVGRETVLYGLGELHLRVLLERIGVPIKTRPPSIPYRETIGRKAEGHNRHKKQTGGAGQFGEVFLRVEPLPRGTGFEFSDEVVGGAIPGQFIPAVEKGVRRAIAEGAVAGFPIVDVRVTVYDGKAHSVDSKEVAFVAAGRKAMRDAMTNAEPIVLEPVVRVDSTVPRGAIGAVTGELSTRRARITGQEIDGAGGAAVSALVPLSEMSDYASRLKSLTEGEGGYTMELAYYDPVPARRQQELAAAFKPTSAEED
jgi:elongation factor G